MGCGGSKYAERIDRESPPKAPLKLSTPEQRSHDQVTHVAGFEIDDLVRSTRCTWRRDPVGANVEIPLSQHLSLVAMWRTCSLLTRVSILTTVDRDDIIALHKLFEKLSNELHQVRGRFTGVGGQGEEKASLPNFVGPSSCCSSL